jgi:copper transport protein
VNHRHTGRLALLVRRGLFVVLATAIALVALASPASAHAELLSSDPAPNAVLLTAPSTITLVFSEAVQSGSGAVRVLDAQQRLVTTAGVQHPNSTTVTLRLPSLGNGGYLVSWHVVSADTHPISGAYTFAVGADSTLLDPGVIPVVRASRGVGVALGIVRAIQFAVLLGAVGVVLVARLLRPKALSSVTVRRAVATALGPGVVTALLGIMLQSANQRGGGLADALSPAGWREVLDTRFGVAWSVRAVCFILFGLVAVGPLARRLPSRVVDAVGAMLVLVLGGTLVYAGHASTGRWPAVARIADGVHLLAGAIWLGGLVLLVLLAVDSRRGSTAPPADAPVLDLATRFSPVALLAVAAVSISGAIQGWRQSGGSIGELLDTTYGRVLAVKVGLVVVVVVVARQARARVRHPNPSSGARDTRAPALNGARRLVRLVGVEVIGLMAVLAMTSALVDATPPRAGAVSGPIEVQKTIGNHVVDVLVDPARVGASQMHVTLFEVGTFTTVTAPVEEVTAELRLPSRNIGPITVHLVSIGSSHYVSRDLTIPFPGDWELTVKVRVSEFDESQDTFDLPIR